MFDDFMYKQKYCWLTEEKKNITFDKLVAWNDNTAFHIQSKCLLNQEVAVGHFSQRNTQK